MPTQFKYKAKAFCMNISGVKQVKKIISTLKNPVF